MNIFDKLLPSAPSQRTAFDLTQRHIYSQKIGQDVPVLALDMLPKDFVDIDVLSLVRTMPINTSAYARMKARFQFIFVPYQQLWHGWNQYFLQTDENMSSGSSYNENSPGYFLLGPFLRELCHTYVCNQAVMHGAYDDTLHLHGTNYHGDIVARRKEYLITLGTMDSMGFCKAENAVRLMDMLGYGAWYTILERSQAILNGLYSDYTLPEDPSALWDELPFDFVRTTTTQYDNKHCNLFRALAYQKAWQDYFMNKRVQSYQPQYFNIDARYGDLTNDAFDFFVLHYHPWSYDLFTGLYTSPQMGEVSLISGSNSFNIVADQTYLGSPQSVSVATDGKMQNLYASSQYNKSFHLSPNTGISVYDIKRAEYLQHWKENKLRAGSKLQDQARVQWNARFKYLADEYSEYLGETIMNISIDEVINTADNQGDISGKGIGTTNGHIKFETEDAGVLLCICSITPNQEYDASMIDKQNTILSHGDFPSPYFDRLGFEGVPAYLLDFCPTNQVDFDGKFNRILGYTARYAPWKTAVDKVHGEFMGAHHVADGSNLPHPLTYVDAKGSLSAWTMPRIDIQNLDYLAVQDGLPDTFYYVTPSIADSIFAAQSDSSQVSDHFLFNTNFVVKIVRSLSGLGLPNWQ